MFQSLLSFLLASTLSLSGLSADIAEPSFDASVLLDVTPVPYQNEEYVSPGYMSATAAISIDVESQSTLYESNAYSALPIASITKLMTAFIIMEENNPSDLVTVSYEAATMPGSSMDLLSGESISVKHLLMGALIESGNDAATALAEYNAGDTGSFVKKMNDRAESLGMTKTHFEDVTGLNANNVSSAHDLALLASHLSKDPGIRDIVSQSEVTITSESGHSHALSNTNILLGQDGISGMKTGRTPTAGECLVSLANQDGHETITVILGSDNRFADTSLLVNWIYNAYSW